jgi:hypothetical protein
MKTKHLFEPDRFGVSIHYKARAGLSFIEYKKDIPPVILNCQPCPALNVRDRFDFKGNTVVTIAESSLVSGGIPPYTVKITRVPPGMTQHSGATLLTGTPALGSYSMGVEVTDSCRIAKNTVNKLVSLQVTDPTPPTLSALSISPSTLPATGGDVVFKITASDNKGVTAVNAAVSGPGFAMTVPLARISGTEKSGVWQGTYKAAANTTSQDVSYTVNCTAWDSDGNKSYAYKGGPVFIVKGSPGGPTPPTQLKYKK